MKTKSFFNPIALIFLVFISFISCEKEEIIPFEEENVLQKENDKIVINETEKSNSRFPGLHSVRRYYAGAPYTSYSYKIEGTNIGASYGNYEGKRFKLNTIDTRLPVPSGTRQLYVLENKAKHDFMFTTNRTERNNIMATGGWYDRSMGSYISYDSGRPTRSKEKAYIHMRSGSGLAKLYRFYDNAGQSIHLFTTNYQEGVSKGYKLEGVIGYVRL